VPSSSPTTHTHVARFSVRLTRLLYVMMTRIQVVAAVVFVDCFLLIFGHTWDSAPTVQTIMNCRLLYTVVWSVLNVAVYVMCAAPGGAAGTKFYLATKS
jgi:hypothetical protein